jgi:hypothetical protein
MFATFTKSLVAAAAVAGIIAVAAPAAEAKTNWDINIGIGVPADDIYPVYREDRVYPVRPTAEGRHHRRPRHVEVFDDFGISCGEGRRLVRSAGFRNVSAFDCDGRSYGYTAWRRGGMYRVQVDALRGRIVGARPTY